MFRGLVIGVALAVFPAVAQDAGQVEAPSAAMQPSAALQKSAPTTDARRDAPELDVTGPDYAPDQELGLGWVLARTFVVLAIVVALIYITLNIGLRRLLGIQSIGGPKGAVTVLERIPLDQKRALFVVRAGKEFLLLGAGEDSISLITKLDSESFDDSASAGAAGGAAQLSPFLMKLLGKKQPPTT